eukprot:876091-Amorphochlora_amoeboformis.AAC.2
MPFLAVPFNDNATRYRNASNCFHFPLLHSINDQVQCSGQYLIISCIRNSLMRHFGIKAFPSMVRNSRHAHPNVHLRA